MTIRITSDSTCDLDPGWLKAHQVELLPLYIIKDGQTFRDGADIHPEDIFAHVAAGGSLCSTAANNVSDYTELFSRVLSQCDAVIHINIGSAFSSCHQNAALAAAEMEQVYVVDSRNLSTGHGLIVCEAVAMAEAGQMTPAAIAEALKLLTHRVESSFLLDQLDYMCKGGRCSAVAALGANLLKLKPCIEVRDGVMAVAKKYRGSYQKSILAYVRERLCNRDDISYDRIFITHTPVEDGIVDSVRREVSAIAPFTEIITTCAGCTISCHCGPGTLGILFLRSK